MKKIFTKYLLYIILILSIHMNIFGNDIINDGSIPVIGPWLIAHDGTSAHWLGKSLNGKKLLEPINVIIIDRFSKSEKEVIDKLMKECKKVGYEEELGHSSGYWGSINGSLYPQIPNNKKMAFSDKDFFHVNNHGRILGPGFYKERYVFIGAFSRESFKILDKIHHEFLSFNIARDDFGNKLDKGGLYKIIGYYPLGNIEDNEEVTTADHDGKAIVLEAKE